MLHFPQYISGTIILLAIVRKSNPNNFTLIFSSPITGLASGLYSHHFFFFFYSNRVLNRHKSLKKKHNLYYSAKTCITEIVELVPTTSADTAALGSIPFRPTNLQRMMKWRKDDQFGNSF